VKNNMRLEQVIDKVFEKLIAMDEKTFNEFIDAHREGDIAQLLLYGSALTSDEE